MYYACVYSCVIYLFLRNKISFIKFLCFFCFVFVESGSLSKNYSIRTLADGVKLKDLHTN